MQCFVVRVWMYVSLTVFQLQWLPQKWQFQWLFLIYRWVLALYYLAWLIVGGVQSTGPKFFIYLTNWALMVWVAYLLTAALCTTTNFFRVNFCCEKCLVDLNRPQTPSELLISTPVGCCGITSDGINWYDKIHWLLFTIATGVTLTVVLLYWPLVYTPDSSIDGLNINSHLTNGIMALLDVWISSTPVRILHMIYLQAFGAAYITFSGIYFAANGTNDQGQPFIYSALDYGNSPGLAAGIVVAVVLVMLPIIHLIFYLQYVFRVGCLHLVHRCCRAKHPPTTVNECSRLELSQVHHKKNQSKDYEKVEEPLDP